MLKVLLCKEKTRSDSELTGTLTFTFVRFQQGMTEARAEMKAELADNPFAGLAEIAIESVQLQWGFALLIVGTVMLLIAAGLPAKR